MISILVLFIIFCFIFFIFLFDDFVDNLLFFWIGRILIGGKKGGVIRGLEKLWKCIYGGIFFGIGFFLFLGG